MSKLVCVAGMNKGDEFALTEGVNIIGRGSKCQVSLFDKKCSREHCQVCKKGHYYTLEDLGSTNGTILNHKQLSRSRNLKIGDHVQIGQTILELSERPIGSFIDQLATDVAADLTGHHYDKVLGQVAENVRSSRDAHHAKRHGIRDFFHHLFHPRHHPPGRH